MRKLLLIFCFSPFLGFCQFDVDCVNQASESLNGDSLFSSSSIEESDGVRNGPLYDGSTIFYPTNSTGFLSSLILVPGFMNTELTLLNWGPYLAAHGFVVMTIGTNTLSEVPEQRKDALLDALISLKKENSRINSPLYNKLDTNRIGVGGFSMGGGGAQLAGASDSTLKAIIALYPFLSNATQQMLNHNIAVLIISGQIDLIAVPSQHANNHYNVTPNSTPKQRFEVSFAGHDPLIGPNAGNGQVGKRVLAWLHTFVNENACYCPLLYDEPSSSSSFEYSLDCESYFVSGCTDQMACNYNNLANLDDGSCEYPELNYDCQGNCLYGDNDEDGICDCENMSVTTTNCDCESIDKNTYAIFFTDVNEDNCTLIEDCYCQCYNDFDNDGICDENEVSFNCQNGFCINPLDGNGIYSSLEQCQLSCGLEPRWDCIDNVCGIVDDGQGQYISLEECESSCVSTEVFEFVAEKRLKKITNLLGQEIEFSKNTSMLFIYFDGTVEKKIILEK
jgi:hypothetical protein